MVIGELRVIRELGNSSDTLAARGGGKVPRKDTLSIDLSKCSRSHVATRAGCYVNIRGKIVIG